MRLWGVPRHNSKDTTLDDAVRQVDRRAAFFGETFIFIARLFLLVLFIASLALTALGVTGDLSQPFPGIGWALIAITAVPAILQTLDWLWPNAPFSHYRALLERLRIKLVAVVRRRALRKVFASYGRQEIAARLLSNEKAAEYSVVWEGRRRRRWRIWSAAILLLVIATTASYLLWVRPREATYRVGQEFPLDEAFMLVVPKPPECHETGGQDDSSSCSVDVRFHNVSRYSQFIGSGSFAPIGPDGPTYFDYRGYAAALVGSGNYYDYFDAKFPTNHPQPGEAFNAELVFNVRRGVIPDELLLYSRVTRRYVHVVFR